jgi:phosphoribosylanthranilate isomerase
MDPTRVKICGLTQLHDAELAVQLGAWALGMVFYEPSPRRCSLDQARRISSALRRRAELCGVFVNAPLEEIAHVAEEVGLTLVQLHGDEGPSLCAEVERRTGAEVIKAAQVADAGDIRALQRYHVAYHLLDSRPKRRRSAGLRGGTGETFDWDLAAERRSSTPLILGGGLTPENVTGAIETVYPFAVDTASGTERAPGHKDHDELRAFFGAVERAQAPVGSSA